MTTAQTDLPTTLLGPPCGYTDILDDAITRKLEREATAARAAMPLRPSSAGHCTRKLAFELAEYRGLAKYPVELRSPAIDRLLALGHSIEWHLLQQMRIIDLFKVRYTQQVVSFFKLNEKEWLEGSIDMVVWSEQWKAVGDVKSKGDKFANYYSSKWEKDTDKLASMESVTQISPTAFWVEDLDAFLEELDDPFFADNFYQLNLYANSEFLKERNVDHAFILQYNKNDSRIREVRFKPSTTVFEKVRAKFLTIIDAVDVQKDPLKAPRDYESRSSFRCKYCAYKTPCWADGARKNGRKKND